MQIQIHIYENCSCWPKPYSTWNNQSKKPHTYTYTLFLWFLIQETAKQNDFEFSSLCHFQLLFINLSPCFLFTRLSFSIAISPNYSRESYTYVLLLIVLCSCAIYPVEGLRDRDGTEVWVKKRFGFGKVQPNITYMHIYLYFCFVGLRGCRCRSSVILCCPRSLPLQWMPIYNIQKFNKFTQVSVVPFYFFFSICSRILSMSVCSNVVHSFVCVCMCMCVRVCSKIATFLSSTSM